MGAIAKRQGALLESLGLDGKEFFDSDIFDEQVFFSLQVWGCLSFVVF
jgi:hypothetical protein